MNWLTSLTGIDTTNVPDDARMRLVWTNAPHSWQVFLVIGVLAALIAFVIYLYRKEVMKLSPRAQIALAALRIAALLLLAIVYLAPALAFTSDRVLQPVVVLLRDKSQSMQQRDVYPDETAANQIAASAGLDVSTLRSTPPTRNDLLQRLFDANDNAVVDSLEREGRVRLMNFGSDVELVETRETRTEDGGADSGDEATRLLSFPAVVADGQSTDIHKALSEALSQRLIAAIIIATDGQHTNRERSRDELLVQANKASEQGIPLLTIGTGDPSRPRNLQVSEVYADAQAWKNEPFEIQAVLRAQGLSGETVKLELIEQSVDPNATDAMTERIVATREVKVADGGVSQRESFTHTSAVAGRFGYTVRATPVPGEQTTDDNAPHAPVEVKIIDEQARILMVAGAPTWEYRAVRQLLEREKSVDLSCWLQSLDPNRAQEGNTVIKELPHTKEEIFKYDVVLFFDPNPVEFDDPWIQLLKQFVDEHAGGFLYMAGPLHSSRLVSLDRTKGMNELLPIRMGDVGAMEVATLLESNNQQWPLGVVSANLDQPLMRMFPERSKTLEIWQQFPGIYWSFPASGAAPTARVLIEHSDPSLKKFEGSRPLLVTGNFGSGRTVFVGFNGTWRWRQLGSNAEYFNRFWLQTTRFLVEGRSLEGKRRGTIETDQFRYEIGDRIAVTAVLKDERFNPLERAEVTATIEVPGEADQQVVLRPVANQPGQYAGTLVARNVGRHIVKVNLEDASAEAPKVETTLTVTVPSVETERTWLDKPLLVELASASGGRYFELHELDELSSAIPDRSQTISTQGRPIPLWDTNRVLILLVLLLGCEWALRKRMKLL